jgi:hypothetical protein
MHRALGGPKWFLQVVQGRWLPYYDLALPKNINSVMKGEAVDIVDARCAHQGPCADADQPF